METSPKVIVFWVVTGIISLFTLGILFASFGVISAGERGVVLNWGKPEQILEEGFYSVNPISKSIVVMNVQVQKVQQEATAASKDLQTVSSTVALNYHLDPSKVLDLYATIGKGYESTVIDPAIQESVKAATALYTAEELISKREAVKESIKSTLQPRLKNFWIVVDEFSIINFEFSRDFAAAIEAKQVVEQQALQSENKLKQVKFEAQQQIEQAKAQAETTRLQVEALKQGSEVIELRKVEALLEAAKKWDGKLPVNIYGSAPLPLLNLSN